MVAKLNLEQVSQWGGKYECSLKPVQIALSEDFALENATSASAPYTNNSSTLKALQGPDTELEVLKRVINFTSNLLARRTTLDRTWVFINQFQDSIPAIIWPPNEDPVIGKALIDPQAQYMTMARVFYANCPCCYPKRAFMSVRHDESLAGFKITSSFIHDGFREDNQEMILPANLRRESLLVAQGKKYDNLSSSMETVQLMGLLYHLAPLTGAVPGRQALPEGPIRWSEPECYSLWINQARASMFFRVVSFSERIALIKAAEVAEVRGSDFPSVMRPVANVSEMGAAEAFDALVDCWNAELRVRQKTLTPRVMNF